MVYRFCWMMFIIIILGIWRGGWGGGIDEVVVGVGELCLVLSLLGRGVGLWIKNYEFFVGGFGLFWFGFGFSGNCDII